MITFPAWFREDADKPPVYYLTEASVPKGWTHVPGSYNFQTGQWIDAEPTEAAEAPAGADDLPALRAAYKAKFGKKAFNGWDAAKLREKLD